MLSIIIPAYNEEATLERIVTKVLAVKFINDLEVELVIVDDCSKDNTLAIAEKLASQYSNVKLVKHKTNQGKGAAIHSGIAHVKGDYAICQDADLEYDPEEINILLKPMLDGHADIVYGSRFMGGRPHRILFYWHTKGNKFLTGLSNMFSNLNLTDMETCYKLCKTSILKNISLKEKRFGIEPELTAKLAKIPKIKIYEVGISYYGRTYEEGKKINWKDGFRAIYCILRYNLFN